MEYIKFFIDNWFMFVTFICVVVLAIQRIIEFIALPTEKKKTEIQARVLEWVRKAESELGSETGKFKLAQVYDEFCKQYPELKKWFNLQSFELFVKDSLEEMEKAFENDKIKSNALKQ